MRPKSFYCSLKPLITNNLKATYTYYVDIGDDSDVARFYGISSSRRIKVFEGSILENGEEFKVNGAYEEEVEVTVLFQLSIKFDGDLNTFFVGVGEWQEADSKTQSVRQKYSIDAWASQLDGVNSALSAGLFSKVNEVDVKASKLSLFISETEAHLNGVSERLNDMESVLDELSNAKRQYEELEVSTGEKAESVNDLRLDCEKLLAEVERGKEDLRELHDSAWKLKEGLDKTHVQASETSQKALDALESTTTKNLAEAFKKRKDEARSSEKKYTRAFYLTLSVSCLFAVGALAVTPPTESFSLYLQYLMSRAPVFAFLIWLAYFTAKKSSQYSRIEEFYAQKQALAESFQGYKKQVEQLYPDEVGSQELIALMGINLVSIGKDSSEVIDKLREEKHNPVSELLDTLLKKISFNRSQDES